MSCSALAQTCQMDEKLKKSWFAPYICFIPIPCDFGFDVAGKALLQTATECGQRAVADSAG